MTKLGMLELVRLAKFEFKLESILIELINQVFPSHPGTRTIHVSEHDLNHAPFAKWLTSLDARPWMGSLYDLKEFIAGSSQYDTIVDNKIHYYNGEVKVWLE